jgi:TolB protein
LVARWLEIAWLAGRDGNWEIYVMDASGLNQTNLTNNPSADLTPEWSPDGNRLVFASDRDGDLEVYAVNADGTNQVNLSNNPGQDDSQADWSPDGTKIALVSPTTPGRLDIFVMDLDGSNRTNVTENTNGGQQPDWSPDGTKIAYYGVDQQFPVFDPEIFVVDAEGTFPATN